MSLIGRRLGSYRIERLIGQGGMAEVYLAHDYKLNRWVAIKVLPENMRKNPTLIERLRREARATERLDHPHIIKIFEVDQIDGIFYIAMEYIGGQSLAEHLRRRGRLSPLDTISLVQPVASALDAAHQKGLLHRDIKPANVLLDRKRKAIVSDFGIVKGLDTRLGETLTVTGSMIGTPRYMSPEQIKGGPLSPASDTYSLAIMTYEMLVGRPPFTGDNYSVVQAHLNQAPPLGILPPAVRPVFQRALDKNPARRFATATDFVRTLSQAVQSGHSRGYKTPWSRPSGLPESNVWLWVGGAAIILFLFFILAQQPASLPAAVSDMVTPVNPDGAGQVEPTSEQVVTRTVTSEAFPTQRAVLFTPYPVTPTSPPPRYTPTASSSRGRVLARDTAGYRSLAEHLLMPPVSESFSPDGRELAITEGMKLYTVAVDGSAGHIWLEEDETIRPVSGAIWSPDGQYIAFMADYKQNCGPCRVVGLVRVADGYLFYLKPPPGQATDSPRWIQDGRLLVTVHPGELPKGTTYIYNRSGQGQAATGNYELSSSHEGQKWFPWLPGRTWQVGSGGRPDNYYND